jgi:mono/diheme cytochrome c family protein
MADALYALLNRLGFTDPLHALMVHMPIGLMTGTILFVLVAVLFRKERLALTARHASILAFIFIFPTVLTGVLDWLHFYHGLMMTPIKAKIILASAATVILLAGIILGARVKLHSITMTVVYALAFVAMVGLGYFGGGLVYGGREAPSAAAGADVQVGLQVFTNNCADCHRGGGNVVNSALPLKSSKKLAAEETFVTFIRGPMKADGSAGDMPAFGADLVSDAQASELYRYVKSAAAGEWK